MLASPRNSGRQGFPVAKISGFTLVELLTVIAIIMILAGIVVGVQRGVYSSQANAKARGEIQAIATALEQYKATYGTYPRITSDSPGTLYQHLVGTHYSKFNPGTGNSAGTWANHTAVTGNSRPMIDASKLTVSKTGTAQFNDPWGNPYVYIYNPASSGNDGFGEHFFILYSKGPGGRNDSVISDPDRFASSDTYFTSDATRDDIVYGLEYSGIED